MLSGIDLRRVLLAVAMFFLCAAPLAAAANDESINLSGLMAVLSKRTSGTAEFTELRYMAMLSEPVKSTGTLRYVAPDELERNVITPKPMRMTVHGREVTVDDGKHKPRTVSLDESLELAAIIESIRGALAGDQKALEQYYALSVDGSPDHWTLQMIPKTDRLRAVVDQITMTGHGDEIVGVETIEHGGDRTVMTITKAGP